MRYLLAALLLSSSFTSALAQGVSYVGDLDSINRAMLESPKLPMPMDQRPLAHSPTVTQPMANGYSMQMDPNVEQVQYTRAARVKKAQNEEEPAEKKTKSSFFSKMKPSWLFGDEEQMETPAQKDPFLAAQSRRSASQISTQAEPTKRVSNAGFDQLPNQARQPIQNSSSYSAANTKPTVSANANQARSYQIPRNGGIDMRRPSKPKGLLNHLGLMGDSSQDEPATSKPAPVFAKSPAQAQPKKKVPVVGSISNPFVSLKKQTTASAPKATVTKSTSVPQKSMQPTFVSDQTPVSLSSATDGVKGFGIAKLAKEPIKTIQPDSITSDEPNLSPSEEDFFFVSDDIAMATDSDTSVSVKEELTTTSEGTEPAGLSKLELPSTPEVTEAELAKVLPAPENEPIDMQVIEAVPMLVTPNESAEAVEVTSENVELPVPQPFVETSKNRISSTKLTKTLPLVAPTQNPFAKNRPIADANKQPSERSRVLLGEAHNMAEYAASREDFSAIIQRCRYVLAIDDAQQSVDYANELAAWGLNKRGELLLDQGRNAEARVDFNDAINCDRDCWRAEHNLGVIKAQSGDYLIAKRHFDRTLDLNPEFAKAYANRAALLIQSSKFQEALNDYQRAIEVDPDLAMAHAGRGRVCHMLGNLEQALRHLDAAELLSPNDAVIALGRGDLLVDLGRYGQARQAYEQAIILAPKQPNAYRNLAWMLATCPSETFRNGDEALANAQLALELTNEPDDIALDTHAAALAAVGRFDEAIPMLQEAIKMAPKADAEVYTERLAMYEQGEAFTSVPVGLLKQATYISDKNQSSPNR